METPSILNVSIRTSRPQEPGSLTSLVACVVADERENGVLGRFAHVGASLAHHFLKGLHHGILHADIRGLRTGNKF